MTTLERLLFNLLAESTSYLEYWVPETCPSADERGHKDWESTFNLVDRIEWLMEMCQFKSELIEQQIAKEIAKDHAKFKNKKN